MFARLFGRKRNDSEFKSEIDSHIQLEAERLREQGLTAEQAYAAAHRAFGNVTKTQERFYERGRWLFWDNLSRDLRLAFRMLRNSPSFTVVSILTLAMAIGANAVVFAALNALILHPLDVPRADRLYGIEQAKSKSGYVSYPDYLDLRDRNQSLDGLAAYNFALVGLDTGGNPIRAWAYEVSANYFDVLEIQPYLGRFFHASDEHGAKSTPYVVLSYAYWHVNFQDDRGVVGRAVQLNKHPFTVVGVAPPGFHGTLFFASPAFYFPLGNLEDQSTLNARGNRWIFESFGKLKPGVTRAQAIADFNSIGSYLKKTYPNAEKETTYSLAPPSLYGDYLGQPVRAFVTALMLLAGLILLAACANLGSLFAARAADRSREVALRLALGSSRARILRQLFTEAVLFSVVGAAFGLWGGSLLLRWLTSWNPFPQYPMLFTVNPDANVYAVALLLAVASGLLFGAVPVRQVLRTNPYEIIKAGSLAKAGRRITARDLLLGAQIAICAVLITSSFVAVRGLMRSLHGNFGIQPQNAILADVQLDMAGYSEDQTGAMQKRMIEAMETIPGVTSVGLIDSPPLASGTVDTDIFPDNATDFRPVNAATTAVIYTSSPGYLRAAGTALLGGRELAWQDDKNAPRVAVVNQEFARRLFGSSPQALGGYFKRRDGTRIQVVGVVENGKYESLTDDVRAAMFLPFLQSPSSGVSLVVRSAVNPQQVAEAVRSKLRELDPGLPSFIQPWDRAMEGPLFPSQMAVVSLGILGLMGAILSVTGVFGIAAYSVSKRKRELGIRIALGARRKEVLRAALGHAVKLLAFGSAAGLILGILAARVLASIVYEATPRDPFVLTGVVLAMLLVGLLATWIPAHRALSIDPAMLLREE